MLKQVQHDAGYKFPSSFFPPRQQNFNQGE